MEKNNIILFNGVEKKYIQLRILTPIDCDLINKKITQILNYLNVYNFLPQLTTLYIQDMRAEKLIELPNIPSLTIDRRDNKLRFKYFNGASTIWTYHVDDLIDCINTESKKYEELVKKYEILSKIIFDFSDRFDDILNVSYSFYPKEDSNIEIKYKFLLNSELKHDKTDSILFDLLKKELDMNYNNIKDLKFIIDYDYQSKCSPCEKAKKEKEKRLKNEE